MDVELLVVVLFVVVLYLIPTFMAVRRGHHQVWQIALINVFLGWTIVGWIVALNKATSHGPLEGRWEGTTSNVQHEPGQPGRYERYAFILLGSTVKPDGSEERFEKSVEMQAGEILGQVFNGRQVVVHGEERNDGWIHATKIVDKQSGAVTEPKRSHSWLPGLLSALPLLVVGLAIAVVLFLLTR